MPADQLPGRYSARFRGPAACGHGRSLRNGFRAAPALTRPAGPVLSLPPGRPAAPGTGTAASPASAARALALSGLGFGDSRGLLAGTCSGHRIFGGSPDSRQREDGHHGGGEGIEGDGNAVSELAVA